MHTELPAPRPDAHNGVQLRPNFAGNSEKLTPSCCSSRHPRKRAEHKILQKPNRVWWAGCGSLWSCWMLWSHYGRVSNVTPESEASSQNHHHHHHKDSATLKHVTSPAPTDSALKSFAGFKVQQVRDAAPATLKKN